MHTIDKTLGLFRALALGTEIAPHLANGLGHRLVGQEHELLDQLVGILAHLEIDTDGHTLFVYLKLHLGAVEGDSTLSKTAGTELFGQTVQLQDLDGIVTLAGLNDVLGLLVSKSAVAPESFSSSWRSEQS